MTDSEERSTNPWQDPPEAVLESLFDFFLTLERDGEPLLRVCSHVCSAWRRYALEARLRDTGASKPSGWRHLPLPNIPPALAMAVATAKDRLMSPPAPDINDKDDADTSVQAVIVKTTRENSVSVGYCKNGGGTEEINMVLDDDDGGSTEIQHRNKINKNNNKRRSGSGIPEERIRRINRNYKSSEGDSPNLPRDNRNGGSGSAGGGEKRQKLSRGHTTSIRERVPTRGLNIELFNEEIDVREHAEANKEGNRNEKVVVGAAAGSPHQEFQALEEPQGEDNEQQGLGWALRIWGAVQRFARRI